MKKALAILFLSAVCVFSAMVKRDLRENSSPLPTLQIGEALPDFTLLDSQGKEVTFSAVAANHKFRRRPCGCPVRKLA